LEDAVLGACLLEKAAYDDIAHILDPECFYLDKHQRIFRSIERLASAANPVDILTVTNDLKQTGELEQVGGPYYITSLTSRIASTANIQFHAMILYQKHIQRMMISTSSKC